jgi:hypothetical protein
MILSKMQFRSPQRAIEEQIHKEFQAAFDELERASGREKTDANALEGWHGPGSRCALPRLARLRRLKPLRLEKSALRLPAR